MWEGTADFCQSSILGVRGMFGSWLDIMIWWDSSLHSKLCAS